MNLLNDNSGKFLPAFISSTLLLSIALIVGFLISNYFDFEGPKTFLPFGVIVGIYLIWVISMNLHDTLSTFVQEKKWRDTREKISTGKGVILSDINIPDGEVVKVVPKSFIVDKQKFKISKAWIAYADYDGNVRKKYLHLEIPGMEDSNVYWNTHFSTYEQTKCSYALGKPNSMVFALPVENINKGNKMTFFLVYKGKSTNLWFHVRMPN